MLFNLFKKKPAVPEIDYSALKVDLHSHLIPGIDDGSQSLEQSVSLIRNIVALGFEKIITTPHIMADYYRNTPEIILSGLDKLREELVKQNVNITIEAGAEYYLDETFDKKLNQGNMLTIGKEYLLFELSYINYPQNLYETISNIRDKGYKPVLAHPERYPYFLAEIDNFVRIKDAGCLLQLNTISLTGYYGKQSQKMAEDLVDNFLVDFMGSDMHHEKHAGAMKNALSLPYVHRLVTDYQLLNPLLAD